MNRLILFACFTVLFQKAAFSDCMPMGFRAWPQENTIVRNPLIIFSFYERVYFRDIGRSNPTDIGKNTSFFLNSTSEKIPLKLIQQNCGQSGERQLIFKPLKLLDANTNYELSFHCSDSLLKEEFLEDIGFKPKTWTTNETIDKQVPVWKSKPQFWYKNYVQYGCGPESYWRFCMTFKDESAVFVQTIVRHLETGRVSEFYLQPDSNSVFVGYGMCGGEFDMIPGEHYSVSFNLIDGSGNSENRFSEPLFVRAPLESEYLSEEELQKKECACESSQITAKNGSSINLGWVLGIVGVIVLIAFVSWYRGYKKS